MTSEELVDTLAGSLELLAGSLQTAARNDMAALSGLPLTTAEFLLDLARNAREAAALAGEPREDLLEEAIIALRGIQNDVAIARGTGTQPVVSAWTWEKAVVVLRRAGVPAD